MFLNLEPYPRVLLKLPGTQLLLSKSSTKISRFNALIKNSDVMRNVIKLIDVIRNLKTAHSQIQRTNAKCDNKLRYVTSCHNYSARYI